MADVPDGDGRRQANFTRRILLLGGAQAAGFALVGWRLFDLQVLEARRYAPLAEENRINSQVLAPKRGRILDTFGHVLADNDEVFRATITRALASNVAGELRRVGHLVPLTEIQIEQIVTRARKQGRHIPTLIASDLTFEQVAKINLYAPSLPGVATGSAWRRRYHGGPALSHVVGFVGSVERFGMDDDAVTRLPETRIGKSGAELGFDSELRGAGGTQKVEVDARGRIIRNLETVEPVAGHDVTLTIDADLQRRVVERMQIERRAAAVMLDIATGEIAVLASLPGFDPAEIAGGISDADWQKLTSSDDNPLLNRAISGQYVPGSTFLVVTALAALEAGVVTPDEHITCDGHYEYAGQTYFCSKRSGHGSISLHDAIRSSCEVFFCAMSSRLGIERIAGAARAMGLGTIANIGLTEEKAGVVPDPDWKRGNLNSAWLGGETLLTGLGQGYMQATPLQLAVMAARIASGRAVVPLLQKRDASSAKPSFAQLPFGGPQLDAVRAGMIAAVNDEAGTAEQAKLGEGKAVLAGKTGTPQVISQPTGDDNDVVAWAKRAHALFVGYEPADAPRYAIATVVEHGGNGGLPAAMLARDIVKIAIERDRAARTTTGPQGRIKPSQNGNAQEAG